MANFLRFLTYWASNQLNFCHWTWAWPQKLKNVIFLMFSDLYQNPEITRGIKTMPFFNFEAKFMISDKIKLNWCPKHQNWQISAISRQYTGFQKISGSFQEWWNLKFYFKNQFSWQKLGGIHTLHVKFNQNWPIPGHLWNPGFQGPDFIIYPQMCTKLIQICYLG